MLLVSSLPPTAQSEKTKFVVKRGEKLASLLDIEVSLCRFPTRGKVAGGELVALRNRLKLIYTDAHKKVHEQLIEKEMARFKLLQKGETFVGGYFAMAYWDETYAVCAVFRRLTFMKNCTDEIDAMRIEAAVTGNFLSPYADHEPFTMDEMDCLFTHFFHKIHASGSGDMESNTFAFMAENARNKNLMESRSSNELATTRKSHLRQTIGPQRRDADVYHERREDSTNIALPYSAVKADAKIDHCMMAFCILLIFWNLLTIFCTS